MISAAADDPLAPSRLSGWQWVRLVGNVVGQPICHNPRRAAQYYLAARKVFRSAGTKITGLDVLDQNSVKSSVGV